MKYVDYAFYAEEYHSLGAGSIPEEEFPFWARKAEYELDMQTCGNIAEAAEAVKLCVCELAETMYQDAETGDLAAENNDGYSVTYAGRYTLEAKINNTVRRYLSGTGLLYRGYAK